MDKPVIRFGIGALLIYGALTLAWPLLKTPYSSFYRGIGNTFFAAFGSEVSAQFVPWTGEDEIKDTDVVLRNRSVQGTHARMPTSSRYDAYVPTCVVVALILASPIPWRRRLLALIWGLILVYAFLLFRLSMAIINTMSDPGALQAFDLAPAVKAMIAFFVLHIMGSLIASSYIVPVFIWLVVTFRRQDWDRLRAASTSWNSNPA